MAEQLNLEFPACQRWRERRERYVPAASVIDPRHYAVEPVAFTPARAFVQAHHYSGSMPAARRQYGLWEHRGGVTRARLVGVAVFSVPVQQAVVPRYLGVEPSAGVELGRLVLLDEVAANGESWFVSRALRLLQQDLPGIRGVVAYCDPVPRSAADGTEVKPGHIGTVYRALSARHLGRSAPRSLVLGRDGRVLSERALSKARNGETGCDYALREIADALGVERDPFEEARNYVARAMRHARRIRHPGNLVFGFAVGAPLARKAGRARMAPAVAYRPTLAQQPGAHDRTTRHS